MPQPPAQFDAIAIGASAGGVEALLKLLDGLPASFPAAMLIVLHLPADRRSVLAKVLGQRCALPVKEAQDKETIVRGTVFIAPPDYHLLVEPDRSLSLSQEDAVNFSRPSIDLLFESAAYAYRDRLLGIVLTGANEDGSAGLKIIKQLGGATWVQQPQDAFVPVMPQSAINAVGPDCVLPLKDIRERLMQLN